MTRVKEKTFRTQFTFKTVFVLCRSELLLNEEVKYYVREEIFIYFLPETGPESIWRCIKAVRQMKKEFCLWIGNPSWIASTFGFLPDCRLRLWPHSRFYIIAGGGILGEHDRKYLQSLFGIGSREVHTKMSLWFRNHGWWEIKKKPSESCQSVNTGVGDIFIFCVLLEYLSSKSANTESIFSNTHCITLSENRSDASLGREII